MNPRAPEQEFRRAFLLATSVMLVLFALTSATQSALLNLAGDRVEDSVPVVFRLAANAGAVIVLLFGTALLPIGSWTWASRAVGILGVVLLGGCIRFSLQVAFGIHTFDRIDLGLWDSIAASVTTVASFSLGLVYAEAQRRLRRAEQAASAQALDRSAFAARLQEQEMAERKQLARQLQSTLTSAIEVAIGDLEVSSRALFAAGEPATAQRAEHGADRLKALIDQEVHGVGQLIYPDDADGALADAVMVLVRRYQPLARVSWSIDADVYQLSADDTRLPIGIRLLLLHFLGTALNSAVTVRAAPSVAVDVYAGEGAVTIRVVDDGKPSDVLPELFEGVAERLHAHGGLIERELDGASTCTRVVVPLIVANA